MRDPFAVVFSPEGFRALLPLTIAMILAVYGLGYRRLTKVFAISLSAAVPIGFAAFFLSIPILLSAGGRGEGTGVLAMVGAFSIAGIAAAVVFIALAAWLVRKWPHAMQRERWSPPFLLMGFGATLLVIGPIAIEAFGIQSDEELVQRVAQATNQPLAVEAADMLRARGTEAVPCIVEALHKADPAEMKQFENGRTQGAINLLRLLGEIGGPGPIAELRVWLDSDYAPDVRATAAAGLGQAKDIESADAIAALLAENSYEWRKVRWQLVRALGLMRAVGHVPEIAAAADIPSDDAGSGSSIMLIHEVVQALTAIGAPEAQQAIDTLRATPEPWKQQAVTNALDSMGNNPPT